MPFKPGNSHAASGGLARAAALTPERRAEIARLGFDATTQMYFDGDAEAHTQWLAAAGQAAQDSNYPKWMRVFKRPAPHPKHVRDAVAATRQANGDIDFEDCHPNGGRNA